MRDPYGAAPRSKTKQAEEVFCDPGHMATQLRSRRTGRLNGRRLNRSRRGYLCLDLGSCRRRVEYQLEQGGPVQAHAVWHRERNGGFAELTFNLA